MTTTPGEGPVVAAPAPEPHAPGAGRFAALVALGILASRVAGLVRERALAHYFGNSDVADALKAAFRIPNLLQNLFGEGVLSASFIPVYARLLAERDTAEARRVAGAVGAALTLAMGVFVLVGLVATPVLVDLLAPGFDEARRTLTIALVRVLFPGVALLVLSAWCLGILNSHRRFFLSYAAPVIWNAAIIAALLLFGSASDPAELALRVAWGAVIGSAAQLALQLPRALRLAGRMSFGLATRDAAVRTVFRNFGPAFVSRGVLQVSAYFDQLLASLLPLGAVAALGYAQILYTLPVSLFGMSVSAAELPLLSSAVGDERAIAAAMRSRLEAAMRRVALFIVPSMVAFLALGDVVTASIYRTGRFGADDVDYVWGILAGSSLGLLAATLARLLSASFYALHDTRTPLRFASLRLAVGLALGIALAFAGPRILGIEARWGAVGLTLAAGVSGWIEFALLRRALERRIGPLRMSGKLVVRLWAAALLAAAAALAIEYAVGVAHPWVVAVLVLGPYGLLYFAAARVLGVPEARELFDRARERLVALRRT